MAPGSLYRFGVEIELLLESTAKPNKHASWLEIAEDLSRQLAEAGIRNHVQTKNYSEWSIAQEITVIDRDAPNPNPYLYGVELISPIHVSSEASFSSLHSTLNCIFAILSTSTTFTMHPTPHASTHIHISRTPPLSVHDLAAVCKASLYFESALDSTMPPERSNPDNHWARSNRANDNPALRGLTLAQCLAKIDTTFESASAASVEGGNTRPIVEVMNLVAKNSKIAGYRGKEKDFVRGKAYKWNLEGMLPDDGAGTSKPKVKGTIEFRQPPGSMNAEDVTAWVTMGVGFVSQAVEVGHTIGVGGAVVPEEGGSTEELHELLAKGMKVFGLK